MKLLLLCYSGEQQRVDSSREEEIIFVYGSTFPLIKPLKSAFVIMNILCGANEGRGHSVNL